MSEELLVGGYELKNCVASGASTQIWEVAEPGSSVQLAMKLILDEHRKDGCDNDQFAHSRLPFPLPTEHHPAQQGLLPGLVLRLAPHVPPLQHGMRSAL